MPAHQERVLLKAVRNRPAPSGDVRHDGTSQTFLASSRDLHSDNIHFLQIYSTSQIVVPASHRVLMQVLLCMHHRQLFNSIWAEESERQNYHLPFKPISATFTLCSVTLQLILSYPPNLQPASSVHAPCFLLLAYLCISCASRADIVLGGVRESVCLHKNSQKSPFSAWRFATSSLPLLSVGWSSDDAGRLRAVSEGFSRTAENIIKL